MSKKQRTKQRQIRAIAEAAAAMPGVLGSPPYWYVQMKLPKGMHPAGLRTLAANHPPGWIPVVPITERAWAELLLGLFVAYEPDRRIRFELTLTNAARMDELGLSWYEWGDRVPDVDVICEACGLVGRGRPGRSLGCSRGCLKGELCL